MKSLALAALALLVSSSALATPTTTVWAPSTTAIQPFLTPHLTYDTYFSKPSVYPVTTGLTMGVLPFDNLQLEVGFDLMLPGSDPLLFNAKAGVPEDKLFAWQPSLAVGIFGAGTKGGVTDYDVLYAQAQHSLPFGGFLSLGGYYGLNEKLLASSAGEPNRAGFIGGIGSPDITVDAPWLQKITITADVQTGKNAFGAAAGAINFFFTDKVSVLTGPVYFFDPGTQPGGRQWFWTVQLDIDMPLRSSAPAAAQVKPAPAPVKAEADPAPSAAPVASK